MFFARQKRDYVSLYGLVGLEMCISDRYIAFSMDISKELRRRRPDVDIDYLNGDASPMQLKEIGLSGPDYHHSKFTENTDLVNQAHQQGLIVNVWTVNDSALMKKLIGMGVDYITTDKPLVLRQLLER